jgi:transcriptional regulator with PAS, ATPase and Fis domain
MIAVSRLQHSQLSFITNAVLLSSPVWCSRCTFSNIIFGHSEAVQAIRAQLARVAAANVPVLITGESGTGKDIIARLVHGLSPWKVGPYVKVNCPAIPGTLLESELFGYEKGAFTGAFGMKPGRVEMAHRGTLFLDEISELDSSLQSKRPGRQEG